MLQCLLRIALALSVSGVPCAFGSTWSLAIGNPFGDFKEIWVDADSFAANGDVVSFWLKAKPTEQTKTLGLGSPAMIKSPLKEYLIDMEINCRTREMRILGGQSVYENGAKDHATEKNPAWGRPSLEWGPIFDYCSSLKRAKIRFMPLKK